MRNHIYLYTPCLYIYHIHTMFAIYIYIYIYICLFLNSFFIFNSQTKSIVFNLVSHHFDKWIGMSQHCAVDSIGDFNFSCVADIVPIPSWVLQFSGNIRQIDWHPGWQWADIPTPLPTPHGCCGSNPRIDRVWGHTDCRPISPIR